MRDFYSLQEDGEEESFYELLDRKRNKENKVGTGAAGGRKKRRDFGAAAGGPLQDSKQGGMGASGGAATNGHVDKKKVFEVLHLYDAEVIKKAYQILMAGLL